MEKTYNKLVRDNIVDMYRANNEKPIFRVLSLDEYKIELIKKLGTELLEVRLANNDKELTLELADILEIVLSLNKCIGNTEKELMDIRESKLKERGGFDKRIYLEKIITKDDN